MVEAPARRPRRAATEKWALPAQQARSRATRERLLDAAEECFAEHGYDNAKLADIAAKARCSVGSIYFRFRDKDALFLAIAESFVAETRDNLSNFFEQRNARTASTTIREFVLRTADNFRRHRGLFRAIVERGFEHPAVMQVMMQFREDVIDALKSALAHARKPGAGLDNCVRVIAQMVFGFLLTGLLNPRAPTAIGNGKAVAGLADAAVAYFESVIP